jgi:anaerobic ribonucleoside-triphosphate reductase activating protein
MSELFLSRIHYPITALGYGNRVGIWFQGCSIRCPGCLSIDTWQFGIGKSSVESVFDTIQTWLKDADGITVSGGEPFDQPEALTSLLEKVRSNFSGDILVFSGHSWERLQSWFVSHPDLVDVLISDPFAGEASQTFRLRGSDNQRVHLLSQLANLRYEGLEKALRTERDKSLDVCLSDDGTLWMVGIPERGMLKQLKEKLCQEEFSCATSQAPSFLS